MTDPHYCRCGHAAEAHEHFRAGDDCGSCRCRRFAAVSNCDLPPTTGLTAVLLAALAHR
jgi:hypothetical protein